MTTIRDCISKFILEHPFYTVFGCKGKSIQYQSEDIKHQIFGCYNQYGDWEQEVYNIEEALDYLGVDCDWLYNYELVCQAYKTLTECSNGEELSAIEEAIGYLGEALE